MFGKLFENKKEEIVLGETEHKIESKIIFNGAIVDLNEIGLDELKILGELNLFLNQLRVICKINENFVEFCGLNQLKSFLSGLVGNEMEIEIVEYNNLIIRGPLYQVKLNFSDEYEKIGRKSFSDDSKNILLKMFFLMFDCAKADELYREIYVKYLKNSKLTKHEITTLDNFYSFKFDIRINYIG